MAITATLALGLMGIPLAAAADKKPTAPAAVKGPDLSGVWVLAGESLDGRPYDALSEVKKPGQEKRLHQVTAAEQGIVPLLTPMYREKRERALEKEKAGKPDDLQAACLPQGMPQLMYGPFAMEILQTPQQVNIFSEWNEQTRRVYTDGRPHPEGRDPSYNGHSIGHWEQGTLVVDTVGIRVETLLQGIGISHSEKLHITERLRLVAPDLLEDEMTMADADALVKPWRGKIVFRKKPDMEIMDYACWENNKDH